MNGANNFNEWKPLTKERAYREIEKIVWVPLANELAISFSKSLLSPLTGALRSPRSEDLCNFVHECGRLVRG